MGNSLLSPYEDPVFNSGVVRPFECLSGGWQLIKDQYFLFVGVFLIIVVLVTCIPFTGIIYGAWMIGIYYAMLGRMRGEPASFNAISKGFGHFSQGFVIAFLSGLPFALLSIGTKLVEMRFEELQKTYPRGAQIPAEALTEELTWVAVVICGFAFFHLITGLIFPFAYQLVAERNLSGWQATKLSARAARANFGGVLGLVLVEMFFLGIGIVLCCVGLVFVLPLTKGAWTVAYRQVFPAPQPVPGQTPMPPPPPDFYGAPNVPG